MQHQVDLKRAISTRAAQAIINLVDVDPETEPKLGWPGIALSLAETAAAVGGCAVIHWLST